jgi:hypothetical protein
MFYENQNGCEKEAVKRESTSKRKADPHFVLFFVQFFCSSCFVQILLKIKDAHDGQGAKNPFIRKSIIKQQKQKRTRASKHLGIKKTHTQKQKQKFY